MTSLHEQAWAAYVAAQESREQAARQVLVVVLDGADLSSLELVAVDVDETHATVVLGDGTVHLAVILRDGTSEVALVEPDGEGGWTHLGTVTSLIELAELLGPYVPGGSENPVWWRRHSPDGFELGERAWWPTADDLLYEVVAVGGDGRNQWRPDEYGWAPVVG